MPTLAGLKALLQSLAMLDGVLSIQLGEPVYSFTEHWSRGVSVGTIKNGLGDELFVVFTCDSVFLKGFVHHQKHASDQEHLEKLVPAEFSKFLAEPAFETANVTFFAWKNKSDEDWTFKTASEDGTSYLLNYIKPIPEDFHAWAVENFEEELDFELVKSLYAHLPLNQIQLRRLKPSCDVGEVRHLAKTIGYPIEL